MALLSYPPPPVGVTPSSTVFSTSRLPGKQAGAIGVRASEQLVVNRDDDYVFFGSNALDDQAMLSGALRPYCGVVPDHGDLSLVIITD